MFIFTVNFGFHRDLFALELKGNPVNLIYGSNNSGTVPATVSLCRTGLSADRFILAPHLDEMLFSSKPLRTLEQVQFTWEGMIT